MCGYKLFLRCIGNTYNAGIQLANPKWFERGIFLADEKEKSIRLNLTNPPSKMPLRLYSQICGMQRCTLSGYGMVYGAKSTVDTSGIRDDVFVKLTWWLKWGWCTAICNY
jgi:hypothetical protein